MKFTEYRSKSLQALWEKLFDKGYRQSNILKHPQFSTWEIDDCCAVNWKNQNPIDVCVSALYSYIIDDVLK